MKAKDFVLSRYPKARAERQVSGGRVKGMKKAYYLIRPELHVMYIGSGDTESKAWIDARDRIIENEQDSAGEDNSSTNSVGNHKSPFGPGA
jgi:hypothetical protein